MTVQTFPSDACEAGQRTDFSGLWIPLITPFRGSAVDHAALASLVKRLSADGVTGFVACGSTGEAAALDKTEQRAVLATVVEAAAGRPVVMGLTGYHLPQTLGWAQELESSPIAGLLVPPPHYIRPSQSGLLQWFGALADASKVPLILYDIPYRTGVRLDRPTLLALAEHPNIQAVKDCGGDMAKTLALIAQGRLQVLAGEDIMLFATLAQGGVGAITATAHLHTTHFVQLVAQLRMGALESARALWSELLPWIEASFAEPNPAPIKAMLAQQGLIANELRAPMTLCSPQHLADMLRIGTHR